MNERKSASLKGLFFRELYLGRKSYLSLIVLITVYCALFSLILLSLRTGNLALMEDAEEMRQGMDTMAMYFSAIFFAVLGVSGIEVALLDLNTKWLVYIYASPVKEEKFIAVKYIISFLSTVVGVAISVLAGHLFCGIHGTEFTSENFAVILCITAVVVLGNSYFMVLAFLFRNQNTVVTVFSGTFLAGFFLAFFLIIKNYVSKAFFDDIVGTLMSSCVAIAPFTPLIIIAVMLAGYLLSVLFAKRRYK